MRYQHRRTGRIVHARSEAHSARLDAHRAWTCLDGPSDPAPPPAPVGSDVAEPDDGVRHAGGPWFEVVVDGATVDKVSGRANAEARFAELT